MDTPLLWHIPLSHFNEKVRWTLDYKRIPHRRQVLGADYLIRAWRATGHGRLPILFLDGRAIGDSTHIIAALEERYPEPPLYPGDAATRQRALALEDYFDEQLGPALRAAIVTPPVPARSGPRAARADDGHARQGLPAATAAGADLPGVLPLPPQDQRREARGRSRHRERRTRPHRAGAAGPRVSRRRCVHGRRPHGRGDAGGAAAATRDPVPAARRAAAVSAGLPRHAATASGHAVGGRRLPAASRPLRGSPATVGCRVDAAASVSEPFWRGGCRPSAGGVRCPWRVNPREHSVTKLPPPPSGSWRQHANSSNSRERATGVEPAT